MLFHDAQIQIANRKILRMRRVVATWVAVVGLVALSNSLLPASAQPRSSLNSLPRRSWPVVQAPAQASHIRDNPGVVITSPSATIKKRDLSRILQKQSIVTISPQVASGGSQVILTGLRPFGRPNGARSTPRPPKLQVMFGALPAAYAWINADGTVTATAPYSGQPGKSVRISVVLDNAAPVYSNDLFSYPIAHMDVTGPMPYSTSTVGDPRWASGRGHMLLSYAPNIVTFSEQPVFHVSIAFVDDTMAEPANYNPPTAVGNYGLFYAHLQNCDISRVSAPGSSQCRNWDGNLGTWVDATPSVSRRLDRGKPDVSVSGDLALKTNGLFDQANLVRTLRIDMTLEENDTNRSIGSDRVDSKVSAPFTAVVAPSAFIQVKVIPYTIVYQPPGNASTAYYQTNESYSTSFKMGNSTEQNNISSTQITASTKASIKLTIPLSGSSVGFGADLGESWDNTTKTGFGTSEGASDTSTNAIAFQTQWNLPANTDLIPGSGATCISATDCSSLTHPTNPRAIEPFWGDTFVFLVHPQFAMWILDAGQTRYVEIGAVPVTTDATVAQLAACWTGNTSWPNGTPCQLAYSQSTLQSENGEPVSYVGSLNHVTLTPEEAHRFLLLDPFFVDGQSADVRADRGIKELSSPSYGAMIGQMPRPISHVFTHTLTHASDKIGSTSTTLSVTSVRGTDVTYNVSESLFGVLGLSGSISNGTKISNSADMKTTYNTSTAVTITNATVSQVTLNDQDTTNPGCSLPHCHLPLQERPSVNVYVDKQFGGFMFQDPGAPPGLGNIALTAANIKDRVELAVAAVKSGMLRSPQPVFDGRRFQPYGRVPHILQRPQVKRPQPSPINPSRVPH